MRAWILLLGLSGCASVPKPVAVEKPEPKSAKLEEKPAPPTFSLGCDELRIEDHSEQTATGHSQANWPKTASPSSSTKAPVSSLKPWPKDFAKQFAQFIDSDEEENPLTVKVTSSGEQTFDVVATGKLGPWGLAHKYRQSVDARGTIKLSKEGVLLDAQLTIVETTSDWPNGRAITSKRTTKRTYHAACE